jgi:hypothetical protein
MSDGLFFSLILGFFFIVWLAGGGPHRPISFTGPFITPITGENETQNSYGPNLSGKISAGGVTVGTAVPSASSAGKISAAEGTGAVNTGSDDIPNTSPYTGKIFLSHFVSGIGVANPDHEYLTLTLSAASRETVDITGWRLVSIKSGVSVQLPQGVSMLTPGPLSLAPIELQPGATAAIISGPSPVNVSYEENACTNFLANPSNYSLCFSVHSNDADFVTGNWQIYLNENHTLWQKSDTIELVDGNGQVVDSFAY